MKVVIHGRIGALLSMAAVTVSALIMTAPAAIANPYLPVQTQDSAEFSIADGYIVKQMDCTPELSPVFDSVTWNPPGFLPDGGSGMIHDANPNLGGPFAITWNGSYWDVEYQFC